MGGAVILGNPLIMAKENNTTSLLVASTAIHGKNISQKHLFLKRVPTTVVKFGQFHKQKQSLNS